MTSDGAQPTANESTARPTAAGRSRPVTREAVFAVVRKHIVATLPGVVVSEVQLTDQLRDLGADSLDRVDIVTAVQADLGIRVPAERFAGVTDLAGLVDVLHRECGLR